MEKQPEYWQEEIDYLNKTNKAIDEKIKKLSSFIETQKSDVLELKKFYRNNQDDFDYFEFLCNYARSDELVEIGNEQIKKLFQLRNVMNKPYFGRIDFLLKNSKTPMKLYVGLSSIEYDNTLYVVDWRAPVSELFYEYGKGEASYNSPNGKVEGNITLKRQYEIEKRQLKEVYEADANIFDNYLQKILANNSGAKLHNIASTIQAEQNQIIRNLKDNIIIVQGFAGCGKTTVALHRVAYALYRLRNLKSANVLLFSPNEAFLSHISGVLPELGEENTRSATFPKFIRRLLKLDIPVESSDEFTIRYLTSNKKQQNAINEKLKFATKQKMQDWINNVNKNLHFDIGFIANDIKFGQHKLNEILKENQSLKISERIENLIDTVCKEFNIKNAEEKDALIYELKSRLNIETELLSLMNKFLTDNGWDKLSEEKINFEDAILLCVLKSMYQDIIIKLDVKHIVLDEAQDYPLLFIDFLIQLFKHSNFSIFGDIYQKTVPGELNSLEDVCHIIPQHATAKFILMDKTYRSSEEIVEYATNIIGQPRHNIFRLKNNQPVEEIIMADTTQQQSQQIIKILEKLVPMEKNIGIITGDIETANLIFNELEKTIPHRIELVKNANTVVSEQIQIMPVGLSKGLEFDTVIVVEKGMMFENENKNNLLYIACTRAINKLYVIKK